MVQIYVVPVITGQKRQPSNTPEQSGELQQPLQKKVGTVSETNVGGVSALRALFEKNSAGREAPASAIGSDMGIKMGARQVSQMPAVSGKPTQIQAGVNTSGAPAVSLDAGMSSPPLPPKPVNAFVFGGTQGSSAESKISVAPAAKVQLQQPTVSSNAKVLPPIPARPNFVPTASGDVAKGQTSGVQQRASLFELFIGMQANQSSQMPAVSGKPTQIQKGVNTSGAPAVFSDAGMSLPPLPPKPANTSVFGKTQGSSAESKISAAPAAKVQLQQPTVSSNAKVLPPIPARPNFVPTASGDVAKGQTSGVQQRASLFELFIGMQANQFSQMPVVSGEPAQIQAGVNTSGAPAVSPDGGMLPPPLPPKPANTSVFGRTQDSSAESKISAAPAAEPVTRKDDVLTFISDGKLTVEGFRDGTLSIRMAEGGRSKMSDLAVLHSILEKYPSLQEIELLSTNEKKNEVLSKEEIDKLLKDATYAFVHKELGKRAARAIVESGARNPSDGYAYAKQEALFGPKTGLFATVVSDGDKNAPGEVFLETIHERTIQKEDKKAMWDFLRSDATVGDFLIGASAIRGLTAGYVQGNSRGARIYAEQCGDLIRHAQLPHGDVRKESSFIANERSAYAPGRFDPEKVGISHGYGNIVSQPLGFASTVASHKLPKLLTEPDPEIYRVSKDKVELTLRHSKVELTLRHSDDPDKKESYSLPSLAMGSFSRPYMYASDERVPSSQVYTDIQRNEKFLLPNFLEMGRTASIVFNAEGKKPIVTGNPFFSKKDNDKRGLLKQCEPICEYAKAVQARELCVVSLNQRCDFEDRREQDPTTGKVNIRWTNWRTPYVEPKRDTTEMLEMKADVRKHMQKKLGDTTLSFVNIPIKDYDVADVKKILPEVKALHEKMKDGKCAMYVHCNAGVGRTGIVLMSLRMFELVDQLLENEFKDVCVKSERLKDVVAEALNGLFPYELILARYQSSPVTVQTDKQIAQVLDLAKAYCMEKLDKLNEGSVATSPSELARKLGAFLDRRTDAFSTLGYEEVLKYKEDFFKEHSVEKAKRKLGFGVHKRNGKHENEKNNTSPVNANTAEVQVPSGSSSEKKSAKTKGSRFRLLGRKHRINKVDEEVGARQGTAAAKDVREDHPSKKHPKVHYRHIWKRKDKARRTEQTSNQNISTKQSNPADEYVKVSSSNADEYIKVGEKEVGTRQDTAAAKDVREDHPSKKHPKVHHRHIWKRKDKARRTEQTSNQNISTKQSNPADEYVKVS